MAEQHFPSSISVVQSNDADNGATRKVGEYWEYCRYVARAGKGVDESPPPPPRSSLPNAGEQSSATVSPRGV